MDCFFSFNGNHENKDETSASYYFLNFYGTNYTGDKNPSDRFSCGGNQNFGAVAVASKPGGETAHSNTIAEGGCYQFTSGYYQTLEFSFSADYTGPVEGYRFYGWYEQNYHDNSDGGEWDWILVSQSWSYTKKYTTTSENPSGICALYICDISDYTINYNLNGGSNDGLNPKSAKWGQDIEIRKPSRIGHTFTGWTISTGSTCTHYYGASTSSYSTTTASSFTYSTTGTSYYKNLNDKGGTITFIANWRVNSYTISLDRQGGSGGSSNVYATYGSSMPSISVPTRAGYTFQGYYANPNGGGTKYYNSDGTSARNYDIANDTTLYAYWTANSYSINFNLGNGTWPSTSPTNNTQYDKAINVPAPRAPTGYTFAGWTSGTNFNSSTAQSGSESDSMSSWNGGLTKNTYFKNLTASDGTTVTLNANYSANNYTVTFEANGGTVSPTTKSVTFDSTYGTLPTPTRAGYSFTGWTLNGTVITSTTQVKTASDHTLIAQWKANSYTVTFDPNGGSVSQTTKTVTYGSAYGTLPVPTKTGYIFIGWYTAKGENEGIQVSSTKGVEIASNHTLYAHWEKTWYEYATKPAEGDGKSPSTAYIIDSAEDLAWIAKDIADNGTKSNYYKQTKSIDLSAYYWLPIGSDSNHSFNGLYDGQGFEIKNLNTYFPTNPDTPELQVNVGLFGYTAGSANIRGIVLRNATIKGAHNTGGIIGQATGKTIIKDIAIDNLNISTTISYIGTIIGKSESTDVTIKNVVVYSATTSHNHRELNSGEATIDSCIVSIQESKKYHDNTKDGFDFTQWVYV